MALRSCRNLSMDSLARGISFGFRYSEPQQRRTQNKIKVCQFSISCYGLLTSVGKHEFSWAVLPHEGHFLESDVPMAAYLFNSPLYREFFSSSSWPLNLISVVRFVEHSIAPLNYPKSPFIVEGARNVVLETIKRGEEDTYPATKGKKSVTTIILRLYEAFGGHANAQLRIASHIPVAKAYLTNFLEDEQSGLHLHSTDHASQSDTFVKLDFRGFEIKTVKLVIDTSEDAK